MSIGSCINKGKQPDNGLTLFSLYNFIIAADWAWTSFLNLSLMAFICGLILLRALWERMVLTVRGKNINRIIIVRAITAKPKSLPGKILYKKTTALRSGSYKIVLYNSIIFIY